MRVQVHVERRFYAKAFVGYDGETGWTYDGVVVDPDGRIADPVAAPRVAGDSEIPSA